MKYETNEKIDRKNFSHVKCLGEPKETFKVWV